MKTMMKAALAIAVLVFLGSSVAEAAKEYVASNRVFRVVDKKTKTKETITVVANPQNDVDEPVTLCAIWEDTIAKPDKGNVNFDVTLETDEFIITGTENPDRVDGISWACFTAPDDSIAANDLAYVDVKPKKVPKQKASDVVLVEFNVGPQELVEISSAAVLGISIEAFRPLFRERVVRMGRVERKLDRE